MPSVMAGSSWCRLKAAPRPCGVCQDLLGTQVKVQELLFRDVRVEGFRL